MHPRTKHAHVVPAEAGSLMTAKPSAKGDKMEERRPEERRGAHPCDKAVNEEIKHRGAWPLQLPGERGV